MRLTSILLLSSLSVAAAACGGGGKPADYPLAPLGITVTAPGGWSVAMDRPTSPTPDSAVIKHGKREIAFIRKGADVYGEGVVEEEWKKGHTLANLVAAHAAFKPQQEEFATGFGVSYDDAKGRHRFVYVATVGGAEVKCSPSDWIKSDEVAGAISVCKSIR